MPTRDAISGMKANGITLTPEIMAAAYEYLKATPPFSRWGLPPAGALKFRPTKARSEAGHCEELDSGKICIGMSSVLHGHSNSILTTMAHEMIHVRQFTAGTPATRGMLFQKMATQICRRHGFDPLGF